MEDLVDKVRDHLNSIRMAFSGENPVESQLLAELKDELRKLDIPTSEDDRKNLKQDCSRVASDYGKAVREKMHACL